MFILLLLIGILLLVTIGPSGQNTHKKRCVGQHKWVIRFDNDDKRGYLKCKECGQLPGEE